MKEFNKEKKLYDAITNISDDSINETNEMINKNNNNHRSIWIKVLASCACIAVIASVIFIPNSRGKKPLVDKDYPILTIEPLVNVTYPEAISFDDYNTQWEIREAYPLDREFIKAVNDFSFGSASKLLVNSKENINYSPLSLYLALAVSAEGTAGETEKELLQLLGAKNKEELAKNCKALYNNSFRDNEIGKEKIANSLWLQDGIKFKYGFLNNAAENFYASSFNVDFKNKKTGENMSAWISKETNGMINPQIETYPQQILSIINTIYFSDQWQNEFFEENTKEDEFNLSNGEKVKIDFMNQKEMAGFCRGEDFISSSRQLKNGGRMIFVLPNEDVAPQDLASTPEKLNEALFGGESRYGNVTWKVPKMNISSSLDLIGTLKELGLEKMLGENADFSEMIENADDVYINKIEQQSKIKLDEKGVEAAAYTEIGYCGAGMPQDNAEMILDRPFLYAVTSSSGAILFVGICENPTE